MYYEPYQKRGKKRRRRRGCLGRLLGKLLIWVIVIALVACAGLYFLPVSTFMVDPADDLGLNTSLPGSPYNLPRELPFLSVLFSFLSSLFSRIAVSR